MAFDHKKYAQEYYQENREEILLRQNEYNSRPEVKARKKEYNLRPEVKARAKELRGTPEAKAKQKERNANRPTYEPDRTITEKKCVGNIYQKCDRILNTFKENGEPDCFSVERTSQDGLASDCRYCQFVYNINMKYGLSLEEYENWKVKQNNKCFICGIDFIVDEYGKDNSHVDHCHAADRTGLMKSQKCRAEDVRGLLCDHCNKGLGHARENVDTLQNMMYYIQEWKTILQER